IRALFGLIATACSASVLLACPSRRERLPLVGLGAWMASRSVVELVAHHVASGLRSDGSLDSTELATLAALGRVVGVTGYAVASGCWILAATQRVAAYGERSATRAWSSFWPLLPVLLLSTSAAFEPHLTVQVPQQSPEAVWTEVSDVEPITWTTAQDAEPHGSQDVPLLLTRVEIVVAGVLTREGELHLFRGGRHESLDREHVLDPPSDTFWPDGVELVVDRRATLGDLRRAARHLRLAAGLSVVWRSNRLHEASPSARERWAFVEMSARALRARRIDLVAELECDQEVVGVGPRARRSCLAKSEEAPLHADEARRRVMQIESPDDVLVRDWLVANADTRETFALLVPKTASTHERLTEVSGRERPEDPLTRRVRIPDLGEGLLLGVLFALFGAFVATHARMRRSKRPGSFATLHCVWLCVPWVLTDGLGGPYRAHDTRPDEAAARHELRVVVRRVAEATMDGARRWVFVAVLACAIGFGLPLLLAK
ncbi:MAG: hypothetical protein KC586_25605, partial [Myxococcales bacterium]|nr:hypothetical protein [Myxococcales bacterium]